MRPRPTTLCAALIGCCAALNLALAQAPPVRVADDAKPDGAPSPASMPSVAKPLTARSKHASVSLVPEGQSFVAGKPFTVAVLFRCDPEWHVYWKDPGDSGLAPSVKWSLPPGWTAGELQHPKPKVLKGPAGTNYVHEGEVALLVELTPPADATIGTPVTLGGEVRWLECDPDQCLVGRGNVSAIVTAGNTVTGDDAPRFNAWRDAVRAGADYDPKAGK